MVCIGDLDLDRETREQVRECLETADKMEDRTPKFAERKRKRAHELAGLDPDVDTLETGQPDPDAGTLGDLRNQYDFAELTDERFLQEELQTLSRRYSAVESKIPTYAEESLKPRIEALQTLRADVASNDYVEPRTWDALEKCLNDNEIETLGGGRSS